MRTGVLKTRGLPLLIAGLASFLLVYGQELNAPAPEWLESLRERAEKGDADAQFNLGAAYQQLGRGVRFDRAEAIRWWLRAAEQGNTAAQYNVGLALSNGHGPNGYVEAHMWLNLAASSASSDRQKQYSYIRDQLAKKMTPALLADAQRLARAWRPTASPPGLGGGAYRVGDGVTVPTVIFKVEPEFSEEARKAKYQGVAWVRFEVDEKGTMQNPRVLRALGLGLDQKAIEAVKKWRFRPGLKDGLPVAVTCDVEVYFRLQ